MGAGLAVVYPVGVYVGLSRVSARPLGAGLAVLLLVVLLLRMHGKRREHALIAARVPLTVVGLLLVGSLLDDRRFVLALPVLTNVLLVAHFGTSLRTVPIAERFARAQEDFLTTEQVAYCRSVTVVWCFFFVVNGTLTGLLALVGPLEWWTLYAGGLSYVFVGLLAAGEYVVRKRRFRKYTTTPVDRLLSRVFPPVSPPAPGVRK